MNPTARKIKRWLQATFGGIRWTARKTLDADCQSLVGAIPSTPPGKNGCHDLHSAFFNLLAGFQPKVFCEIGAAHSDARHRALSVCPETITVALGALPLQDRPLRGRSETSWPWRILVRKRHGAQSPARSGFGLRLRSGTTEAAGPGNRPGANGSVRFELHGDQMPDAAEGAVETLDDLLRDHAPDGRVALWVDIPRAASLVLAKAAQTLERTDLVFVSVDGAGAVQGRDGVMQIGQTLQRHGLEAVLRDREFGDRQFNMVFARRDARFGDRQFSVGKALDARRPPSVIRRQSPTPASVPVLVPCFNNHTYADRMLRQLQSLEFSDITFVDNASDSEPMRDWLDRTAASGVKVERLSQNLVPRDSIFTPDRLRSLPRWFCVTDPDLALNPALPEGFLEIMADQSRRYRIGKVGFALNIGNRSDLRTEQFAIGDRTWLIWEWERKFWEKRLGFTPDGDPVFRANVDTTFALYDRKRFRIKRLMRSLRIGGRDTANHLPWQIAPTLSIEDAEIYKSSQRFSFYAR